MTKAEAKRKANLTEDEFDDLYQAVLSLIRHHGTNGVEVMLGYLKQELDAGREDIE